MGWVTVERKEKGNFILDLLGEFPKTEDDVMVQENAADSDSDG